MKTITVIGAVDVVKTGHVLQPLEKADLVITGPEEMSVSDGFHTIEELYDHRIELYIALCKAMQLLDYVKKSNRHGVWRSKLHHDGSSFDGWFILGMENAYGKQITYHLPMSRWEEVGFALTFDKAPEWDGHTSADVLERLKHL